MLYHSLSERNSAKNGSTTPPTPTSLSRDARPYASLPSKSTQLRAKYLQTETKAKVVANQINADASDRQTPISISDNTNDMTRSKEQSDHCIDEAVECATEPDRTVLALKVDQNAKYLAITSV